jgi:hypothetical protein
MGAVGAERSGAAFAADDVAVTLTVAGAQQVWPKNSI